MSSSNLQEALNNFTNNDNITAFELDQILKFLLSECIFYL